MTRAAGAAPRRTERPTLDANREAHKLHLSGWHRGAESLLESLRTPTAGIDNLANDFFRAKAREYAVAAAQESLFRALDRHEQHATTRAIDWRGARSTFEFDITHPPKESTMSNENTNLSTKDANLASAMYGRSIGGYVGVTIITSSGQYTFLAPKSANIEAEDIVVAVFRDNTLCLRVAEVDPDFVIPIESDVRYKWIVQKVDPTDYDAINAAVDALAERITRKRTEASVEQAMAALGLSDDDVAGVIANAGQKALTNGSDE